MDISDPLPDVSNRQYDFPRHQLVQIRNEIQASPYETDNHRLYFQCVSSPLRVLAAIHIFAHHKRVANPDNLRGHTLPMHRSHWRHRHWQKHSPNNPLRKRFRHHRLRQDR